MQPRDLLFPSHNTLFQNWQNLGLKKCNAGSREVTTSADGALFRKGSNYKPVKGRSGKKSFTRGWQK